MESTLHRQLKAMYGADESLREVTVDGFRIDAIQGDELIEIQCASLSAIRDKIRRLLRDYPVRLVKPISSRKLLVTRQRKNGTVVSRRFSPSRGTPFHLFDELVHFTNVFPHENLTLELLLIETEEHRVKRKPRRWRGKDYRVLDRVLTAANDPLILRTAEDLAGLLPTNLPPRFTTAELAERGGVSRWLAQKAAYCLRKCGAITLLEKRGRLQIYALQPAGSSGGEPRAA